MPKETQNRPPVRRSPYSPSSSSRRKARPPIKSKDTDEWDQVRCPVCMDHPHNAVLLHCSSHEKGCRPFICNTGPCLSNCLAQYRKTFSETGSHMPESTKTNADMPCPLCRGLVSDFVIDEPARRYLDSKERSCSVESCEFSGIFSELSRHAKKEHPKVCPSDVDAERQRKWCTMERQRDFRDLFSMLNSETDIIAGNEPSLDLDMDLDMDLNLGPARGSGSLMVFFVGQSRVSHMLLRHRRSFSQSMMQFTTGPRAIAMWGGRYLEDRNTSGSDATDGENSAVAADVANSSDTGLIGVSGDNPVQVPSPPPLQDNELSDG